MGFLTVCSRLGHYDVTAKIGEGAMGEVYRGQGHQALNGSREVLAGGVCAPRGRDTVRWVEPEWSRRLQFARPTSIASAQPMAFNVGGCRGDPYHRVTGEELPQWC